MKSLLMVQSAFFTIFFTIAPHVHGQPEYPTRPIRILVPFAAGGSAEVFSRLMMQRLQERWDAQSVVEARPGAGGMIATEIAAKAPPNGYTFIIVTVGHAVNPSLYRKMRFDPVNDFAPHGLVAMAPNVQVVHPSVPVKNVKELVELAKSRPGVLNYGTGGTGGTATTAHVAAAMLDVPYKDATLALQDLIGRRLDLMLDQIASSIGHLQGGRLRALAVTPAKRTPSLPEPTLAEAGVPGYEFTAWWLFLAPSKTPAHIVRALTTNCAARPQMRVFASAWP